MLGCGLCCAGQTHRSATGSSSNNGPPRPLFSHEQHARSARKGKQDDSTPTACGAPQCLSVCSFAPLRRSAPPAARFLAVLKRAGVGESWATRPAAMAEETEMPEGWRKKLKACTFVDATARRALLIRWLDRLRLILFCCLVRLRACTWSSCVCAPYACVCSPCRTRSC